MKKGQGHLHMLAQLGRIPYDRGGTFAQAPRSSLAELKALHWAAAACDCDLNNPPSFMILPHLHDRTPLSLPVLAC